MKNSLQFDAYLLDKLGVEHEQKKNKCGESNLYNAI